MLKDLYDLLKLLLLESLSENYQIGGSSVPVCNLIQRALDSLIGWRVLVRDKLLDLSCPVDDSRLKSLEQVLIFGSNLNI
jgi:hypothetical protein